MTIMKIRKCESLVAISVAMQGITNWRHAVLVHSVRLRSLDYLYILVPFFVALK